MIACDQCGKPIKGNRIMTRQITHLGHTDKEFCNTECLLIHYDQPQKPKNELWKFHGKQKQNIQERIETAAKEITVKDIRKNTDEVDPSELGKPLV
jgi:penicillin-binding protein-related factor A (putative recombinase)